MSANHTLRAYGLPLSAPPDHHHFFADELVHTNCSHCGHLSLAVCV
jgi:hypothetical protein